MSNDKKYTAQEAAVAVLKKAEEMLLAKASEHEKGVHQPQTSGNFAGPGTSHAGQMARGIERDKNKPAQVDYNRQKRNVAVDQHKEKLSELKAQPKLSIPGAAPGMAKEESTSNVSSMGSKGIHKLSKFVGRMEFKKLPNHGGIETHRPEGLKGVHETAPSHNGSEGTSQVGARVRTANQYGKDMSSSKDVAIGDAKSIHKEKLAEIKAQPKPNLTKGE